MVYDEQSAARTVSQLDLNKGGSWYEEKEKDPRPGVVCILASSGSGKTQLMRFMASSRYSC